MQFLFSNLVSLKHFTANNTKTEIVKINNEKKHIEMQRHQPAIELAADQAVDENI